MSLESHVPGSDLYAGTGPAEPPSGARPNDRARRSRDRARWEPISHDSDDRSRARRLARVERDIDLRATGRPCTGCGETSWLAGGTGCTCGTSGDDLAKRCLAAADRVAIGDTTARPA